MLSILFKIKSPSKNVDRLSIPQNVPPEAQFYLKMPLFTFKVCKGFSIITMHPAPRYKGISTT